MIREQYNYAIKVVQANEVEILIDVIYESAHDVPSGLKGFNTLTALKSYMTKNGLIEYVYEEANNRNEI
jgi:hypothetical protein